MLFRFSPLLIARKCSVSHDSEHFYVVWRRFSLHIYARRGVFVNIYKYEAFFEKYFSERIIDFTINDIILLEELKTAEGTIAAEYVFPETEHLDAPETRALSTASGAQSLNYIGYTNFGRYYNKSLTDAQ